MVSAINSGRWELADSLNREGVKRFPTYPAFMTGELRLAALRGRYAVADSLARAVQQRAMAARVSGNNYLAVTADMARLRGQVRRSLQTRAEIRNRNAQAGQQAPNGRLAAGFDSVWHYGETLEELALARGAADRAFQRVPLDSIPPLNRNYSAYLSVVALVRDTVRAKAFHAASLKDRREFGVGLADEAGRAWDDAQLAFARRQPDEMLRALALADRNSYNRPDLVARMRFLAHDQLGNADSAIVAGEAFIAAPHFAKLAIDAAFLPPLRQRLGELYEAKGNAPKALENYEAFVSLWKDADPELQPRVRDVRARIERLRRTRG
jgi:hypothetical protein